MPEVIDPLERAVTRCTQNSGYSRIRLGLLAITRKTDKGLPRYGDATDTFLISGAEDLVPELEKDASGDWVVLDGKHVMDDKPRTVDGIACHVRRYRPRIERWTLNVGGDTHWRVISSDNVLSIYGNDNAHRFSDPGPKPLPDDDGTGNPLALKTLTDVLASRGGQFDPTKARILREPPLKGLIRPGRPELKLGGVIDRQPTLRALFGDQDACACGHCNSVLSPAAYFVDVLQFIKDVRMLETLLGRRPDLLDIELSCNNTNTVVPAIDLALEALENAVALPLKVELLPGTNVEAELSGQAIGAEVRKALNLSTAVDPMRTPGKPALARV